MSEREVSLSRIYKSLFDPSQLVRMDGEQWRIGSDAVPLPSLPSYDQKSLYAEFNPAALKIERITSIPKNADVVIGGLCSIFTGDLEKENAKEAVNRLRMDQLVESIGNLRGKTMFVIMEDSFFSRLTGLPLADLNKQARDAAERIMRWQELTTGTTPDLRVGFTSDPKLEKAIYESVQYMANDVLKNPNFARMQSAPIIMMYTSIWTDLLTSLSYIPASPVVCVEPAVHFVDSRTFPDTKLQYAYEDFTQWLKDNPYAKPNSANQNLGIAGFLESVTGDQAKRRTRLSPYAAVPNTENVAIWTTKLQEQAALNPFPLRNSLIFAEAVNWGLWNPAVRELISALLTVEDEYYYEREQIKDYEGALSVQKQDIAQRLKTTFTQKAQPIMTALSKEITQTLLYVLEE